VNSYDTSFATKKDEDLENDLKSPHICDTWAQNPSQVIFGFSISP